MNYISIKHLKSLRACEEQVEKFKEIFGGSVGFESMEEAQDLALKYAQEFDFYWIGYEVFKEAYEEAEVLVWKVYEESETYLLNAYEEAKASCEAYQEAEAPLWEAYQEAKAPFWKTYEEDCAKIFATMWWELQKDFKVK